MAEYSLQPPPPPNAAGSCWGGPPPKPQHDWRGPSGPPSFHSQQGASRQPPVEPNPNLYIHNVPKDATEEELKDLFSTFGSVERIRLKVNQKIGPQALYAFVTFSTTAEAQTALQRLDGYDMRSRRLRIEFQRSREDESKPHNFDGRYDQRGRSQSTGTRGSSNVERRKRVGMETTAYHEESAYTKEMDLPPFKKPRQYSAETSYVPARSSGSPYRRKEPESVRWTPAAAPPPSYQQQTQQYVTVEEPVTVYINELLRQYKPELFVTRASTHEKFSTRPEQKFITTNYSPPQQAPYNVVPTGSIIWTGTLVRNSKKKVPVDVCQISGNISQILTSDVKLLNISHRSSWDEVTRKSIVGVSFIVLSEKEILENGSSISMTPQRRDLCTKPLIEHLEYLTAKQRAGVVSLSSGYHLYIIPPNTPLFDKYKSPEMPKTNLVLLGLFTSSGANGMMMESPTLTAESMTHPPPPPTAAAATAGIVGRPVASVQYPPVPQMYHQYAPQQFAIQEHHPSGTTSIVDLLTNLLPNRQS